MRKVMLTLAIFFMMLGFGTDLLWATNANDGSSSAGISTPPAVISAEKEKPAYEGSPSVPDPNKIRQGGDDISSPFVIGALPFNDNGTTAGYTNDYDEVCPFAGTTTSPDVVYKISPSTDMAIHISLCGSSYDTKLYVYENTVGNTVACNDDDSCAEQYASDIDGVILTGGEEYYIIVDGYGGNEGNYMIFVEEIPYTECPREYSTYFSQGINWESDLGASGWGHTSDDGPAEQYLVYDNFSPWGFDPTINVVHFWGINGFHNGSEWTVCEESPTAFEIKFYTDNAGQPGSEVASYSVTLTPNNTGMIYGTLDYPVYEYTASLGSDLVLTEDFDWISIQAIGGPDCWFLWLGSPNGMNNEALQWDGSSLNLIDGHDMAFCLQYEYIPPTNAVYIDIVQEGSSIPVDTLISGNDYEYRIWIANDFALGGMMLGFTTWSNDGAGWQWNNVGGYGPLGLGSGHACITVAPGSRLDPPNQAFDMTGLMVNEYMDEISPDSFMVSGVSLMQSLQTGPLEHMLSVHFKAQGSGTLCIDSSFIPPSGSFVFVNAWGGASYPTTLWSSPNLCWPVGEGSPVSCGNAQNDPSVNILDVTYLINYLYKGGPPPMPNECVGDADSTATVNILDVTYLINYLYKDGPPPVDGCCNPIW